jgi:hypothetical protein
MGRILQCSVPFYGDELLTIAPRPSVIVTHYLQQKNKMKPRIKTQFILTFKYD